MDIAISTGFAATERVNIAQGKLHIDDGDSRADYWLDVALEDSFPCSDPISSMHTE